MGAVGAQQVGHQRTTKALFDFGGRAGAQHLQRGDHGGVLHRADVETGELGVGGEHVDRAHGVTVEDTSATVVSASAAMSPCQSAAAELRAVDVVDRTGRSSSSASAVATPATPSPRSAVAVSSACTSSARRNSRMVACSRDAQLRRAQRDGDLGGQRAHETDLGGVEAVRWAWYPLSAPTTAPARRSGTEISAR